MTNQKTGNLRNLDLKINYRSDRDDLVHDFYIPCLQKSKTYKRAVGYFTSSGLTAAAQGLAAFINGNGRMQLVASPHLEQEDIEAIKRGYEDREEIIKKALIRELEADSYSALQLNRLECLSWLIASGRLDIKIGIPVDEDKIPSGGLYHEKIGIFLDEVGNAVAFAGSSNETAGGLLSNFESVDVYWSWEDPHRRVQNKIENFDLLWSNQTSRLQITDFPEAAKDQLLKLKPTQPPSLESATYAIKSKFISNTIHSGPCLPEFIKLRDYQQKAIKSWFEKNGKGILKMATGTGKTITALSILVELWKFLNNQKQGLSVIIICPYTHLVEQWAEVSEEFNITPIICYGNRHLWMDDFDLIISELNTRLRDYFVAITSNATFRLEPFQERLGNIRQPLLIIGDEAHNLGAEQLISKLPDHAQFRLGLSATPEDWFDEERTNSLYEYFGSPVFTFGLKQAIEIGALTPYYYYPHLIELTDEESEEYVILSKKISKLYQMRKESNPKKSSALDFLLFKRARLTANAKNKLPKLKELFQPLTKTTHNLVYCGDGQVEYEPDEEVTRHIQAVVKTLGNDLGMKVNSYTAETFIGRRHDLRTSFASGELQCLVAIRCLDEGVDIPETERAFILASSQNPRQFIQRRGRVLRRAENKEFAEVHDFIVCPPTEYNSDAEFEIERKLVEKELKRFIEFSELALNGPQASKMLLPLKDKFNLLHLG